MTRQVPTPKARSRLCKRPRPWIASGMKGPLREPPASSQPTSSKKASQSSSQSRSAPKSRRPASQPVSPPSAYPYRFSHGDTTVFSRCFNSSLFISPIRHSVLGRTYGTYLHYERSYAINVILFGVSGSPCSGLTCRQKRQFSHADRREKWQPRRQPASWNWCPAHPVGFSPVSYTSYFIDDNARHVFRNLCIPSGDDSQGRSITTFHCTASWALY